MTLARRVDPEWLDELPPDDPRAVRSRRDLRLMNRIMGHGRTLRSVLERHLPRANLSIAELGAGDGTLLLRALPHRCAGNLVFVDRQPVVSDATREAYARRGIAAAVATSDVFEWLARDDVECNCIVANLFLHHFESDALRRLLELASIRAPLFVACEPRRARLPLEGSKLLGLIGCNDVTRHDAHVSVRAGFSGSELSVLWPAESRHSIEERRAGLFSHLFVASAAQ